MAARLPLVLNAQQHDDVRVGQGGFEIVRHRHAKLGKPSRHQSRRSDQRHGGAKLGESVNIGTGDPAEQDVAQDHHLAAAQGAQPLAHRERVEQPLSRVLMGAVPGVDHGNVEQTRQVERGARGRVPQDDHVGIEGLNVLRGVPQRLSLGGRGGGAVDRDHIGAEPLGRHIEGHASPRAGLQEKIDDRLAAQRGHFFHAAAQDFLEGGGRGMNLLDFGEAEFLDGEKMATGPGHVEFSGRWIA